MNDSEVLFEISVEQFKTIQDQLLQLKQFKYESEDKLNKLEKGKVKQKNDQTLINIHM